MAPRKNPLFLEQRLSSLLETRALRKGETGAWRLDRAPRAKCRRPSSASSGPVWTASTATLATRSLPRLVLGASSRLVH